jgi:hypothetical protein
MPRLNATAILTEENYDVISSKLMLAYDDNKLIHLVVDEEGKKKVLSKIDVLLNKTNKEFMDTFYDRIMELRYNLIDECMSSEYDVNNEKHYGIISVPKVDNPIVLVIEELPYYCKTKCVSYESALFTFWKMIRVWIKLRVVEGRYRYDAEKAEKQNFIEFDIGTEKIKSQLLFWTHNEFNTPHHLAVTLKQLIVNDDDTSHLLQDYSVFKIVFKSIMDVLSDKKTKEEVIDDLLEKWSKDEEEYISKGVILTDENGVVLTKSNDEDEEEEDEKEEIPREKTLSKKEKEKLKKQKAKEANKLREQQKKDKAKLAEKQAKQFEKQQKERNKKRIETERKKKLALLKK